MNVVEIIRELESASGTNAKIDIIRANQHNLQFMRVLDAALNPYHTYYIKQIPEVDYHIGLQSLNDFMIQLDLFSQRHLTGNAAKDRLAETLRSLSEEEADIAVRIIRKDLKIGVAASTVNKATGGMTVPIYPCLKATAYSEKALAKIRYPAFSQIKADGMRANLIMNTGNILRSRSGKFIDLLGEFDNILSPHSVLDGELRLVEDDGSWMDRKKGNGLLNKAIRGTIDKETAQRVRFIAWDLIDGNEFGAFGRNVNINSAPYSERWMALEQFIEELDDPRVILSENVIVNNYDEVMEHYADSRRRGEEGTIVKNIDHIWTGKKSMDLVKIKSVKDCDLQITGWNHGKEGGRWENGLGSLICASNDGRVEVNVSGLTDDLREELFENFEDYRGRIVAVEYNERITDKTRPNIDSLFSPRFLELREDKDVADNSEDIK